jgi:Flp pilus assembly protein TadG
MLCFKKLRSDRQGSVVAEVAIMAPLLVTMMFGVVEITQFLRAEQKLAHTTEMLASMVAENTPLTPAILTDMCSGASQAMAPFNASSFGAGIASVTNTNGVITTDWSSGGACPGNTVPDVTNAAALVPNSTDSVIVVSGSYQYSSFINLFVTGSITLTQTAYARPRGDQTTPCTGCS